MKNFIIILLLVFLAGCDQFITRNFGGTTNIDLEPNQRLVNVTWKETHLWVLTKTDETPPSTYTFQESSVLGLLEGKIIIQEK